MRWTEENIFVLETKLTENNTAPKIGNLLFQEVCVTAIEKSLENLFIFLIKQPSFVASLRKWQFRFVQVLIDKREWSKLRQMQKHDKLTRMRKIF